MPELPDLVHVERKLREQVLGRRIGAVRIGDPTVLRVMVAAAFPEVLVGRVLEGVERRGHLMRFELSDGLVMVVNAMLAGHWELAPGATKAGRGLAFALELDDGRALRYLDDKRMGKVYIVEREAEAGVPGLQNLGLDVLSPSFTVEELTALLRKRREQVRVFLMDKKALASIGNAYADEILFAAHLHPKTTCNQLGPQETMALHAAIGSVLRAAIDEIARRDPPIGEKVRDFVAVRGRDGQPCPRCATTIRRVRVSGWDACFCPSCQQPTRAVFIDWRKLPPRS